MTDLRTEFLGFELENPWCVASAPPTATGKLMAKAFDAGWSSAVMKTVGPVEEPILNVAPRIQTFKRWNRELAMQNIELITDRKLSIWLEELRELKRRYPRKMVIGSIMAPGNDLDAWTKLVEDLNRVGCDAIELNLGCPHGMPERGMGSICSQDSRITSQIVKSCKAASKIPLLTKLTPNVTDLPSIALAAKQAGTDAITLINTVNGIIGVDIYKRKPWLSVNGLTATGGVSGPAVKPMGLKCVAECKRQTGLPIAGVGGISTWQDGVEYLILGADLLQVCTEIMIRGFKIVGKLNRGLQDYMEKMGFTHLEQVKGDLYKSVVSFERLLQESKNEKVAINAQTCTGCNICVVACADAGYDALALKQIDDRTRRQGTRQVAELHYDKCTGCNLCVAICPVPDCMKLYDSKESFPYALHSSYSEFSL